MTPVRTIPRRQSTNCQAPRTSTIRQTVSTADALGAAAPAGTSARAGPLAAPLERVARPSRRQSPDSNDVIYELVASHARGAVFGTPHAASTSTKASSARGTKLLRPFAPTRRPPRLGSRHTRTTARPARMSSTRASASTASQRLTRASTPVVIDGLEDASEDHEGLQLQRSQRVRT